MSSPLKATDPYIDTANPKEIAPGIFVFEDNDLVPLRPNTAIVVGGSAALVIDTGLGPENGELMLKKVKEIAPRKKLFLATTHFHPEHAYGAQAFKKDAIIISNGAQQRELQQRGLWYLNRFRTIFSAKVRSMLEHVELTPANICYQGSTLELDLGGRTVLLKAWEMAHTKGDQIILAPKEKILFTGDLVENGIFPIFPWLPPDDVNIDGNNWIAVVQAMIEFDPTIVVPGHGHVAERRLLEDVLKFHIEMRALVWTARKAAENYEEALAKTVATLQKAYAWEQPFWLQRAFEYWWQAAAK